MSDDNVLRIRIESMICQLRPTFQDSTASKVKYWSSGPPGWSRATGIPARPRAAEC